MNLGHPTYAEQGILDVGHKDKGKHKVGQLLTGKKVSSVDIYSRTYKITVRPFFQDSFFALAARTLHSYWEFATSTHQW